MLLSQISCSLVSSGPCQYLKIALITKCHSLFKYFSPKENISISGHKLGFIYSLQRKLLTQIHSFIFHMKFVLLTLFLEKEMKTLSLNPARVYPAGDSRDETWTHDCLNPKSTLCVLQGIKIYQRSGGLMLFWFASNLKQWVAKNKLRYLINNLYLEFIEP